MEDREAIFNYIAPENFKAAVALDELLEQKAALVGAHPEAGRVGRVRGTRELVAHPHYVLIYDLEPRRVRILRVLHTARQWPPARPVGRTDKRRQR